MSNCRLPPALLDLVIARAFAPPTASIRALGHRLALTSTRLSHAVAYKSAPAAPPLYPPPRLSSYPRSQLPDFVRAAFPDPTEITADREISELEKRVKALTSLEVAEEDSTPDDSAYSEEELLLFYEDLLAVSQPTQSVPAPAVEDHAALLADIAERILPSPDSSFRTQLSGLHASDVTTGASDTFHAIERSVPTSSRDIVARLGQIISELGVSSPSTESDVDAGLQPLPVTPGIMTPKEWIALARACALEQSAETVYSVLDLMKRSASPVTDEILNEVLSVYAEKGDVQVVETLFQKCLTEAPTERQRHLHIKSCLRADVTSEIPTRALELLHDYEARGLPAPQQTYTRCITHLFSAGSSVAHAHAWDLFAHMRYAAHPVPDVLLYTLMIRACANSSFSTGVEPERALDLFHEMTVDQRIEPTSGAYTAAILACARSGSKDYVHEAFRLAKQMLDSHRDARGNPAFSPDARFFKALLEGAKRIGDLGRARWILAEMVRVAGEMERKEAGSSASLRVDEDVMVHVFNAYTTYKPPFKRSATKVVDTPLESVPQAQEEAEMSSASSASSERKELVNPPQKSTFTHLPPQTRAELVAEVRLLMDQIVERNRPEGGDEAAAGRFKHVHLTPRLVNAYLSVHYAHTSLDTAIECYQHIFADLGVPRNSQSYVEALERFSKVKKDQREAVRSLGDEIWSEWQGVEAAWRRGDPTSLRLTARIIERAHTAMIRLLSITGQLDRALDHVKTFVELYPFAAVRRPGPQHASRSTRTVLAAARPLVRFTSALDIPDDTVPPFLSFPEVELLHHKLVVSDKVEGIKYLQWVCKSYAGALSIRRDRILAVRKADSEMEDVD